MRLAPAARASAASIVFVSLVTSSAARAQAAPTEAGAPVAPAPTDPSDELLRRVLWSGCHAGVSDVRALAANGGAPWAATVARLCGEILRAQAAVPLAPPSPVAHRNERDGRGTLVSASTLYGIWVGIATDVMFKIDGSRSVIVPPLLGMAAGLGLSLAITSAHPIDNAQSWSIITGLEYGSLDGAFWAGGLGLSQKTVVSTALATGLVAGAVGLVVGDERDPEQGDVEVVRSGLLWGTVGGMLGMAALSSSGSSLTTFYRGAGIAMDLGFLAGLGVAASSEVSRNRVLIIDAGTLGGLVAGGGVTWLATTSPNEVSGRALAAGALAGMTIGMLTTIYLSRHMDDDDDGGPTVGALLGRDARGRWRLGTPDPAPVLDGLGRRVIGATFTAVGGTF
ncbi:MAG TPA: hypothetical protein VLA14_04820 [Polyangia bacterium]|nr:hypothetical protein [Polyangia bacterium]